MMDNLMDNFIVEDSILQQCSMDEFLTYVADFNKDYLKTAVLHPSVNPDYAIRLVDENKELLNYEALSDALCQASTFTPVSRTDETVSLNQLTPLEVIERGFESIRSGYSMGVFTKDTYVILNDLFTVILKNHQGLLSDRNFENEVDKLIKRVDNTHYTLNEPTIQTVGPVLALSQSSIDWWSTHPDALPVNGKIAPWVIADAVGAIERVVAYAITTSKANCNLKDAGVNALVGGVLGSLGGTAKLLKLLKKVK